MSAAISYDNKVVEGRLLSAFDAKIKRLVSTFSDRQQHADLFQVGRIALWEASLRWREDGGASLWTFAEPAVRGAMLRYCSTEAEHGLWGDVVAAGSASCSSASDVAHSFRVSAGIPDGISDEIDLRGAFSHLSDSEFEVLRLHFKCGLPLRDIAELTSRSKSEVGRICQSAIKTLRERLDADSRD